MTLQAIRDSLPALTANLVDKNAISCTKTGHWYREGAVVSSIRWLTGNTAARDVKVVRALQGLLDEVETKPLEYSIDDGTLGDALAHKTWMAGMAAVQRYTGSDDKRLEREVNALAYRVLGLEYRLLGAEGTAIEKPLPKLITQAQRWMSKQVIYDHANLSEKQIDQLRRVCHYPRFVELLERDPVTRTNFFKWAIREDLDVDTFVQFPNTQQRLTRSYIDKRLGRLNKQILQMTTEGKKDVTLLFEGKPVSILDENRVVTFKNDYSMTIKTIFEVFRRKNIEVGHLECAHDGILNWHVFKFGPWNPSTKSYDTIDVTEKNWWKQLPLFESITGDEVERRFGQRLSEGEYGIAAKASRTTPDLNSLDAHGWLEVIIPNEKGEYDVLPIGKYATHFPSTWQEYVGIACATEPAALEYPEENVFRSARQHAGHLFPIDKQQFKTTMRIIGDDIRKAHEGGLVFQALGDNCASWVQQVFDRLFVENPPKLYDIPYYNCDIQGPASLIFGPFLAIPHVATKDFLMKQLFKLLGAGNGIYINDKGKQVYRSLMNSDFWENCINDNPPTFVQRVIDGHFRKAG